MARRSFTVVDVTEILIHWYAGRSLSEVSDSLGVDRKTIRKGPSRNNLYSLGVGPFVGCTV
jgi:hypothetical protein